MTAVNHLVKIVRSVGRVQGAARLAGVSEAALWKRVSFLGSTGEGRDSGPTRTPTPTPACSWCRVKHTRTLHTQGSPTRLKTDQPLSEISRPPRVRLLSGASTPPRTVLGIETSCDDTGAAVVDERGNILGECLNSQTKVHLETGGIIPPVARDLHKENIEQVVCETLKQWGKSILDIDAIATTVKPGLIMSLDVGMKFTRKLIAETGKPFIPIHHMEAHALTARIKHSVPFPFLVLLMSGGHCLLALAQDVDKFLLLGKGLDTAPGDAIDKIARSLRLNLLPEGAGLSGGRALEVVAKEGNPKAFVARPRMNRHYNCDFSFSGARTSFEVIIHKERDKYGVKEGQILPNVADICASFQYFLFKLIANRVRRAIVYCESQNLLPQSPRTLVVSGGVASNQFLRRGLEYLCESHNFELVCPPPKLCTDNGIMIAWNGVEKLRIGRGFADIEDVDIQARSPLGKDWTEKVAQAQIKVDKVKWL